MEAGEAPGSDLMYCLSQRREKRNREKKASGEQPATRREVEKQRQLWGTRDR